MDLFLCGWLLHIDKCCIWDYIILFILLILFIIGFSYQLLQQYIIIILTYPLFVK